MLTYQHDLDILHFAKLVKEINVNIGYNWFNNKPNAINGKFYKHLSQNKLTGDSAA